MTVEDYWRRYWEVTSSSYFPLRHDGGKSNKLPEIPVGLVFGGVAGLSGVGGVVCWWEFIYIYCACRGKGGERVGGVL